jgi:hypothetical protein
MSENKTQTIQDLDVLRPPAEYVRLGGKDIDISFIPSGVAIDLMALQDKINDLVDTPEKLAKVREGGEAALTTFDLSAEMCAKVTSTQFPEMDKAWLLKNTSVGQLKILVARVTAAVYRSLQTAEDEELKKPQAVEEPSR